MARSRVARPWVALTITVLVLTSCSSDESSEADGGTTSASTKAVAFTGRSPDEITRPTAEGKGMVNPQPSPPLPAGYVEEEYFVAGTATSFEGVDTPEDGSWTAKPSKEANYRTRVIVRRPPAEDFSGTVLVEWFNVSALESSPDWAYLADEIARAGHAYIGVSTQAQGVEGGKTLLDVDVDDEAASDLGASADKSGLKKIDPARYGSLVHPGDAYTFDIFSQVARALAKTPAKLLGSLAPKQVIGVGESQSAIFLTTLVNAVHPLDPAFDGFLIHSRGANAAPLDGKFLSAPDPNSPASAPQAVRVRTDLDVPVFLFETETDLTLLGYAHARQPDSELVRTWEVAGTAHADAQLLRAVIGGPRDPSVGSLLGCDNSINTGPQREVLQAALQHVVEWTGGGAAPPKGARVELDDGDDVVIARDEHGIALGGVRNPLVDVPVATLSGDPPGGGTVEDLLGGENGICALFGQTVPFDKAELVDRYGTADEYLEQFRASADEAVDEGYLLQAEADALIMEAEANRALFG
jgi:hypothetical protein